MGVVYMTYVDRNLSKFIFTNLGTSLSTLEEGGIVLFPSPPDMYIF